jgi:GntR family transcriptional regulator
VSIDYDAGLPPYRQLAGIIREQIRNGELAPGQVVPSYAMLVQTYGVARVTARKAIKLLESEGYVTVAQGWGTHVSDQLPS